MNKEQISIRLNPETIEKIEELAGVEMRNRNNMIEVLILEAINNRDVAFVESKHEPSEN